MLPKSIVVKGIWKWDAYRYRALTDVPQVPIALAVGYDN